MYEVYRSETSKKKMSKSSQHSKIKHHEKGSTHPHRGIDDYSEVMRHAAPTTSMLQAYAPKPADVGFDAQTQTEQVILLLRQHPVVLFKQYVLLALGFLAPTLLNATPFLNFLPPQFGWAFILGWYVVMVGMTFQVFLLWFFNVFLITDERIIDVDFHSVVQKDVSTAKIDKIQDITLSTTGAFASFFDYGTVFVQTSAEKNEFEFDNVPHPSKVAALLNEMVIEEERETLEGRVS